MSFFVYALCALTSFGCSLLLLRHYRRERGKLLFYSAIAFLCFALGNILLFIDMIVVPDIDLQFWRNLVMLIGTSILLMALINMNGKDAR